MNEQETITLDDGVRVVVPARITGMTRYVLKEQGQWFESELAFVQRVVSAGSRCIDIGANYGLYMIALAQRSQPGGEVVAIEPTPTTAACLRATIEANALASVRVVERALSKAPGHALLHTYPNSEINTLGGAGVKPGAVTRKVTVSTLDQVYAELGWSSLDFLKLDAEGEEQNIVEGAAHTLTNTEPLLLFELKHGGSLNTPLIDRFQELGFGCYRLLPELGALLPFDCSAPVDRYQLNLFCCKKGREESLAAAGLILEPEPKKEPKRDRRQSSLETPWAGGLPEPPGEAGAIFRACQVDADPRSTTVRRWASLHAVRPLIRQLPKGRTTPLEVLATASRASFAVGERGSGVDLLANLIQRLQGGEKFAPRYRYFPPAKRFDGLPVHQEWGDWFIASVLERYLHEHAFSAYFSRTKSAAILRFLQDLGYADAAIARRASALDELQSARPS